LQPVFEPAEARWGFRLSLRLSNFLLHFHLPLRRHFPLHQPSQM
jgi:hypothetical protein